MVVCWSFTEGARQVESGRVRCISLSETVPLLGFFLFLGSTWFQNGFDHWLSLQQHVCLETAFLCTRSACSQLS